VRRSLRRLSPLFTLVALGLSASAPSSGAPGGESDPLFSTAGIPSRFALEAAGREAVPLPSEVLGHRIGDAYTAPDEILRYVRRVAETSRRVRIEPYGKTPEGRELLVAVVSSERNLGRLDAIRKDLASLADPATPAAAISSIAATSPAVIWIACSVHGNEVAGSEAGLALLWWLAASKEEAVLRLLDEVVVVLDPDVNPDGKARHVSWWRSVAGAAPDDSPSALEHDPPWPEGRWNHAGFDLNRDWAWATQSETRQRIAAFFSNRPQVYVDLHEMGPEASYYFPPPAEPVHPHLPAEMARWMEVFGRANARAFDERGWSYFVREVFDFFYPAYGDSWPSFHGAVGMTFEVGGSQGLARRRKDGTVLTLKERALKHFTATRATLEAAAAHRSELLFSYSRFFREPMEGRRKLFVVPAGQDPTLVRRLAALLSLQGVHVERTTRDVQAAGLAGATAVPAGSLLVDSRQPLGRFAEALLEPGAPLPAPFLKEERTRLLQDERDRFYDVTAWSLPIAWNLDCFPAADRERFASAREPWTEAPPAPPTEDAAYGWLLAGDDYASRKVAAGLLDSRVQVSVTTAELRVKGRSFPPGSYLVKRESNEPGVASLVSAAAAAASATALPLSGAWTEAGPSFGSTSLRPLAAPRVALLADEGVDPASAAALADSVERDLGIRVSRRRVASLRDGLAGVTVLLVPNGGDVLKRELLREENAAPLRRFVEEGGVVIAVRDGAHALREKPLSLSDVKVWEAPKPEGKGGAKGDAKDESVAEAPRGPGPAPKRAPADPKENAARTAAEKDKDEDEELLRDLDRRPLALPGAALKARVASPHPLVYGLRKTPVFLVTDGHPPRRLPEAKENVVSVVASDPLAAGFAWREALDRWAGAPLVQVETVGKGKVVTFSADPVFRGTWLGTEALLLNAILHLRAPD
jgi:predicted deacylase